ncbi:MAG: DUF4339 domain-containing protein [Fimbriimonadaceae bacterium]
MGAVGNLDNYMKFQAADAMVKGAENPGGMGGAGAQMAAGLMMGQQMAQSMTPPAQAPAAPASLLHRLASSPPLPTKEFFVGVNGQQTGPYAENVLGQMIASGQVQKDTLVWSAGMDAWKAAGEVAELSGFFGQTPPPMPQ